MPVVPNHGKLLIPLDGPEAVEELMVVARTLDPVKVAGVVTNDGRIASDIGDHLMFLSIVHPEWFTPFCDEVLTSLHNHISMSLPTAAALLSSASNAAVGQVLERLEEDPTSLRDLSWLAGIGSDSALSGLANHARKHPGCIRLLNRMGVHVGTNGPALRRFTPACHSLHSVPEGGTGHMGLPVSQVAEENDVITWHYLSFQPAEVPELPPWPHSLLHIVSPRTYWYTLNADTNDAGKYINARFDDCGEPYDEGMAEQEASPPAAEFIVSRPYYAELVVRNGHIEATPGVLGTVGGPPVGIYPNPVCGGCNVLMFHGATITTSVRRYGEGFRSVFYCSDCTTVAVAGTNWN